MFNFDVIGRVRTYSSKVGGDDAGRGLSLTSATLSLPLDSFSVAGIFRLIFQT